MTRTTIADLNTAVRILNQLVMARENKYGAYCLQGAYGGWQLQRIVNTSGGVSAVTTGYRSKRELLDLIHAYTEGVRAGTDRVNELQDLGV